MSGKSIAAPFAVYADTDGQPLDNGYIYIGEVGTNAEANPAPVYWDSALTIPAVQPLRTSGGYVVRNGSPANVYVNSSEYSILVKNKHGALVFSSLGQTSDPVILSSDYATIQQAAAAASGKALQLTGDVTLVADLVLNDVYLDANGYAIDGSYLVRGVLTNEAIPFDALRCAFNLSLARNRYTAEAADFYVDPCLGDDTNNGTAAVTPFRTLSAMRAALNAQIGLGADTNITVVLRDGRHELGAALDFNTAQATATVTLKSNNGENPVITPEMLFFFRDGATASNPTTENIYSLFDVENGWQRVPISTTSKDYDRFWMRNTQQAVTLVGSTATIVPDAETYALLAAATNLSKARLRVMQSWSSSLYHSMSLSGGVNLDFTIPGGQTNFYYNGFDAGVNSGYAPYMVEGLDSARKAGEWCNLGSSLMLPDVGSNIYSAPVAINTPLTISADRYVLDCISFGFHMPTATTMEANYFGSTTLAGSMVSISGDGCTVQNCHFAEIDGSAIYSMGSTFTAQDNTFNRIGHTAIASGQTVSYPFTVSTVRVMRNTIEQWGYNYAGGKAIIAAASDCWIKDNVCRNGMTQAINTQADTSGSVDYQVYRNEVSYCGMPFGEKSDRWGMNDAGAIYHNGLGVACNYRAQQNVIFNVNGFMSCHGIYMDNGTNGATITQNLVFNVQNYALDCRDVSSTTKNNSVTYNLFYANVRLGDVSGGAYTNNYKVVYGGRQADSFGAGVTITSPASGQQPDGYAEKDYVTFRTLDDLRSAGGYAVDINPIAKYLLDPLSGIDERGGTFTPIAQGTTAAGAGTYTRQIGRWKRRGQMIEYWIRLTWTAHTGTGNLQINLNDIPYQSVTISGMVFPCTIWPNGLTFTPQIAAYLNQASKLIDLSSFPGTGTADAVAMDTAADIAIHGTFPIL